MLYIICQQRLYIFTEFWLLYKILRKGSAYHFTSFVDARGIIDWACSWAGHSITDIFFLNKTWIVLNLTWPCWRFISIQGREISVPECCQKGEDSQNWGCHQPTRFQFQKIGSVNNFIKREIISKTRFSESWEIFSWHLLESSHCGSNRSNLWCIEHFFQYWKLGWIKKAKVHLYETVLSEI